MRNLDRLGWAAGIAFVSYGLRIGIRTDQPEVLEQVCRLLPPRWRPSSSPVVDYLYSLRVGGDGRSTTVRKYSLLYAGAKRLARSLDVEELFELLESELQLFVAEWARRRVF